MKHTFVVTALLLSASLAHADDGGAPADTDVELAKAHFNTGQIDYDKGRFIEAAKEFEEAYRLSGRTLLLYNMGKSYDGASDFARALGAYRRYMDAVPESADRKFAANRVQLLMTLVGKVAITDAIDGSSVTLDGNAMGKTPVAIMIVNPGHHAIELQHEGYANFKSGVDVPVGGDATLAARQVELVKVVRVEVPTRDRTPVYKKWWLWTIVGGVVVAGGVAAAVVLTTKSATSGLQVQLPAVK